MQIDKTTFNDLAFCAFRYALGRRTYITWTISDILYNNKGSLSDSTRNLIKKEIQEAIQNDNAGDDCDKKLWAALLANLEK